jgi:Uma2 family endonuclease
MVCFFVDDERGRSSVTVQTEPYLTPQEYLALERSAECKSEYLDGERVAMSRASREHVLVVLNLASGLKGRLQKRPSEVYASGMRVQNPAAGFYVYPEITVAHDKPRFEDEREDTLLNPVLIVEVFSPSTESYDRGRKFEQYRTLESLQEYVLVAQDQPRVEQFFRQNGNVWLFKDIAGLDQTVSLASVACEMGLHEIYDRITFPEPR